MPRQYEAIRDKFIKEGLATKVAKQRAAKIYNAGRGEGVAPVTRGTPAKEGKPIYKPRRK